MHKRRICACGCGQMTSRDYIPYKAGHEPPLIDRITKRVVESEKGCWLWQGTLDVDGYGMYAHKRVHRTMWECVNGPISTGMFVCHHCDIPACCNPDHLFIGTAQDNNADRHKKGRSSGARQLTDRQVYEIRQAVAKGERPSHVARRFGVTYSYVWSIASDRVRKTENLNLEGVA